MDFRIEIDGDTEDSSSTTTTTSTSAPSSTMTLSSPTVLPNKQSLPKPLLTLDEDEDEYAKVFPIDPENPPPIELAAVYKRNNALIKSQMPVAVINTDGSLSIGIPPTPKELEIEDGGEARGGRGGDGENENEEDEEDDGGFLAFVVLTGGEQPSEKMRVQRRRAFTLLMAVDLIFITYVFGESMTSVTTETSSSTGMSLFLFLTSVVFDVFGLTGVYTNSLQSLTLYLVSIVVLFFFHLLTYLELFVFFRFIILSALFVVGGNIRGSMILDWFPSSREVQ